MLLGALYGATCEAFVLAQELGSIRRLLVIIFKSQRPMLVDDQLFPMPGSARKPGRSFEYELGGFARPR
jgi:hypothetical protein